MDYFGQTWFLGRKLHENINLKAITYIFLLLLGVIIKRMIDRVPTYNVTRFEIGNADWFATSWDSPSVASSDAVLDERVDLDEIEKNAETGHGEHKVKE